MSALEKIQEFERKEQEVIHSGDLSQDGKARALKQIADEKIKHKSEILSSLKSSVFQARDNFKKAENKLSQAIEESENKWSFDRLRYYARVISGEFESAEDLKVASSIYEKHKSSNNRNAQRVASEVGSSIVKKRFGSSPESGDLRRVMASDLEELKKSEEVERAQKEAEQAVKGLLNAVEEVKQVKSAYYKETGLSTSSEFDELLSGIRINRNFDASREAGREERLSVEVE